jgi:hypothetical protein
VSFEAWLHPMPRRRWLELCMSLDVWTASAGGEKVSSSFARLRRVLWTGLAREPLVHFFVIGSLVFATYAVVAPSTSKERLIEVTPEARQTIIELFESAHQRKPTAEELAPLIDVYILNEITYREALAQGLDKGDEMIRERIMQKMRLLVFGNVIVTEPTDAELKQWYEARHDRYDIPDSISFFEVPIGDASAEAEANSILQQIEVGNEPEDIRLRAHIFADRPRKSLEGAFGKPFVDALTALPKGQWNKLQSSAGWHIVRFESLVPGRAAEWSEMETQLINDWKDDRARMLGIAAIREMGKSYVIRRNDP